MRTRGFTLVELMVVVAIIAAAAGVGLSVYTRSTRAEKVPQTARALYGTITEARHAALAQGKPSRLRLQYLATPKPHRQLLTEQCNASYTSCETIAKYSIPNMVDVCVPVAGAQLTTVPAGSVTCPFTTQITMCVEPSGRTTLSDDDNCPGSHQGLTFFLRAAGLAEQPQKIAVYGLTGMAKVLDRW